jgi:hypothetical protein
VSYTRRRNEEATVAGCIIATIVIVACLAMYAFVAYMAGVLATVLGYPFIAGVAAYVVLSALLGTLARSRK